MRYAGHERPIILASGRADDRAVVRPWIAGQGLVVAVDPFEEPLAALKCCTTLAG